MSSFVASELFLNIEIYEKGILRVLISDDNARFRISNYEGV